MLKIDARLGVVRHEVKELCLAPTAAIDLHRDQRRAQLDTATDIQRSVLVSIGDPGQHLRIGKRGLGLCNGGAPYAAEDEFVPELFGRGDFFAGGLFTSLTAVKSTMPRPESRLTASSNGSSSVPPSPSITLADR